jgi:hypothetical protein
MTPSRWVPIPCIPFRTYVCAHSFNLSPCRAQVYPKTPTQMAHIKKGLQACHLFHNFEEALLHEIIDSLEPYSVKPGTEVITQVGTRRYTTPTPFTPTDPSSSL